MTACPAANDLAQLLDGTLASDRHAIVERHLDDCAVCGELLEELARLVTPGISARAWAATHTADEILALWRAVIAELATRHRAGGVHGALSPDCVSVGDDGVPVVAHAPPSASPYTSVEQLHGGAPSPAADQFALCASLWDALAGKPPFRGSTPGALAVAMMSPPVPPVTELAPIFTVVARGLRPDPAARWPDLDALLAALAAPPPRRRWPTGALLALAIAALGAIAVITRC